MKKRKLSPLNIPTRDSLILDGYLGDFPRVYFLLWDWLKNLYMVAFRELFTYLSFAIFSAISVPAKFVPEDQFQPEEHLGKVNNSLLQLSDIHLSTDPKVSLKRPQ